MLPTRRPRRRRLLPPLPTAPLPVGRPLLPGLLLLLLSPGPSRSLPVTPAVPFPDPCALQPCRNNGTCSPSASASPGPGQQQPDVQESPDLGYSCTCPAGVTGSNCQTSCQSAQVERVYTPEVPFVDGITGLDQNQNVACN